mgnify:CR=1 FL=1
MNVFNPLDQDIIEKFCDNFADLKQKSVVLYGVGEKTKLILKNCKDFNFVGVMDKQSEGTLFGLPVLDEQQAIEKADCIILICAISNIEIIYKRIQNWTSDNNIPVYHLNGTELKRADSHQKPFHLMCNIDKYKQEIQLHDIISFDMFDTLIMRYTLYSCDIAQIIEEKLKILYPDVDFSHFAQHRKQAEQNSYKNRQWSYTLTHIYEEYTELESLDSSWVSILEKLEFQTELENILPRNDVVELLDYAKNKGKKIILTSDMYLSTEQITLMLRKTDIDPLLFDDIYISNEYSISKESKGLWKLISNKYCDKKILHFGDNEVSDGKYAIENKIDYLPVYNSLKLATSLFDNKWMKYEYSLSCRYVMGIFVSHILNSPFKLDESCNIKITSLEEIGYNFFGPVVKYFMDDLYHQARDKNQKIIFQARDCWILKQLADKYYTEYNVESTYLLTSRRAIALASIKSNNDIEQVCNVFMLNTEHTLKRFLKVIFNITIDDDDIYSNIYIKNEDKAVLTSHIIKRYSEKILSEAKRQNKCFFDYINKLKIDINEPLAIINFVGSGTTQLFFQKTGFTKLSEYYYFATNIPRVDSQKLKSIISVFGESSNFTGSNNNIAERTIFGEFVFTSPQSQFMGFGVNGESIFADTGINNEYDYVKEIHNGIEKYIRDFKNLYICSSKDVSVLINIIYGYLFDNNIFSVPETIRHTFRLYDTVKSDNILSIWN